jgi:hypothetical protein
VAIVTSIDWEIFISDVAERSDSVLEESYGVDRNVSTLFDLTRIEDNAAKRFCTFSD